MLPDGDKRHGTNAGYIAGCRNECCRVASLRYSKRLKLERVQGKRRTTETWRAQRRLDALACLGWSRGAIADEIGIKHKCQLYAIGEHPRITLALFDRIDAAFERLSMTLPPTDTAPQRVAATKARNNAKRRGAWPPLAWVNIDDPDERPSAHQRPTYSRDELLAEWDHLRRCGESMRQAADRLGVTVDAIEKAIERDRRSAA